MLKTCFKCGKTKPITDFYAHKQMKDGHLNKCKECTKRDANNHRNQNLDFYRKYDIERSKTEKRRALSIMVGKKWEAAHRDRKNAQQKLRYAVKTGKVIKHPCFVCGKEKTEGHLPDYSRPLDVVWLCEPHHAQAHALLKKTF